MGDFVSPKRAVVDRLRRRIETYKRGHKNALNRGHYSFPQYFENQRQDTALLHQKWIEGKAKKAAKNTRVNKETPTASGTQTQTRPKKFKTDSSSEVKSSCEAIEEHISSPLNQQDNIRGSSKHSVSVNIEQIIKTPQSSGSHIEIKLKSTVHTSQVDSSTSISTSTNICKEEPQDTGNSNPSSNGSLSIGIDDVDELQEILDALEQGSDPILKDFEVDHSFPDSENLKKENNSEQALIPTPNQDTGITVKSVSNPDFPTKPDPPVTGSNTFFDSQQPGGQYPSAKDYPQQTRNMYPADGNQQYSNMATQGPVSNIGGYNRPAVPIGQNPPGQAMAPSIPSFADTGPAAKTLQQMAAQHQSHSNVPTHYGSPGYMPDSRNNISNFTRTGYDAQGSANGTYQYNQNVNNMPMYMKGHEQEIKPEPVGQMPYTAPTKPLTHYDMSARQSTGNSIQSQQIHNQNTKGQYSQASNQSGIQITQSQQVSVNPAQSRMNFSQTQQMQVHSNNAHPLTLSQQQSFHLGSGNEQPQSIPPQHIAQRQQHIASVSTQQNISSNAQGMGQTSYMTEQMKLQMYQEKMMQQQEIRNRMQQQQMQQQQGQFSGRPPPSYSTSTVPHGGMNSNPLQTMQNMVEQTNQSSSDSSYQGPIKQNNIPGHTLPQSSQANTSGQSSQNYPNVQSNQTNGPTVNNTKADSSNYTSTIMRGQRPPNVNIGPEGLNISQPRMNQWRQMAPSQSHGIMHRPPSDPNHQMPSYQNYGGHMPSNMYPYRMQMAQQQSMHIAQQHQQRMPMQGGVSNTMTHNVAMQQQMRGTAPIPQASVAMMMSQQQHMHQQMNSNQMVGSSLSHSHQSNTVMPNVTGVAGQNPNFPLDFLDQHHHPQSGHSDLFDPVQNGNPADFNFEDILGGK